MSLTYDLSTNTKWTTLADGTHNITIVAKAAGYRDSNASGAVVVNKTSSQVYLLNDSVTIEDSASYNVNFTCNDVKYTELKFYKFGSEVYYNDTEAYYNGGATDEKYRLIIFDEAVTDSSLLAWLQSNATKYSGISTIKAGTYQWLEAPEGFNVNVSVKLKINTLTSDNAYGEMIEADTLSSEIIEEGNYYVAMSDSTKEYHTVEFDSNTESSSWAYYYQKDNTNYNYTATDTTQLRIFEVLEDTTYVTEMVNWFNANTTKIS